MANDEKIIAALVANTSVRAAAQAAGVSESTVYSKLRESEFSRQLRERRIGMLQGVVTEVQSTVAEAFETIAAIMRSQETSPQQRLNAAALIITQSCELDRKLYSYKCAIGTDRYVENVF